MNIFPDWIGEIGAIVEVPVIDLMGVEMMMDEVVSVEIYQDDIVTVELDEEIIYVEVWE
jgi:hypothetical protein